MDVELPLRITLAGPPEGVLFCLQRGRDERVAPVRADGGDLSFDLSVRVVSRPDGALDFRGPFVQGRPGGRFVYVRSGTSAGDHGSCWSRRAKIGLEGILPAQVDEATRPGRVLEGRIPGRAGDGGPSCGTVPLLDGGWTVSSG